uniref:Uncharacterized protein n=1 Tax=Leersia perrieri TaxID=77586 RepID=A0A0D9XQ61_9ORYZ
MNHLRSRLLTILLAGASHLPTSTSAASSSHLHHRRILFSTSSSAAAAAATTPFSVEDYLVGNCGLIGDQARNASAKISHLKSTTNPDAVLAVLSGVGLSRADLAAVVAADPQLLFVKADNIASRISSLRDRAGLSDSQIARFLLAGGAMAVHRCDDVAQRLEFWIPFCGSFEMFLKMVESNCHNFTADIEKVIKPNIALLQECGLTVRDIANMSVNSGRVLTSDPEQVKAFVQRADMLGVPRTSSRFKYMVSVSGSVREGNATARMNLLSSMLNCSMDGIRHMVCKAPCILRLPEVKLRRRVELLRSTLGCSIGIICEMLCKMPIILGFSENNLWRKLEFLITKVHLEPEYILSKPVLLTYSLEKRLVLRHYIVQVLVAKGLINHEATLTNTKMLYLSLQMPIPQFVLGKYLLRFNCDIFGERLDFILIKCLLKSNIFGWTRNTFQRDAHPSVFTAKEGKMLMLEQRRQPGFRRLPLLRLSSSPYASAAFPTSLLLSRALLSTAANATATIPFSVEEYLVATCGLTGAQAIKSSAKISHLKSASNPDAVLALLSGVGLSRADLAAVVASDPQILCGKVDNIARRIASLRDRVGLTDPQIRSFLLAGGAGAPQMRHRFWIPILGSFETLLKLVRRNNAIVVSDVERVVKPNVALLQDCGLTVCDIVKLASNNPRLLMFNPERVKTFVQRADMLGVQRTSSRFKYSVAIAAKITQGTAMVRMMFLGSTLKSQLLHGQHP